MSRDDEELATEESQVPENTENGAAGESQPDAQTTDGTPVEAKPEPEAKPEGPTEAEQAEAYKAFLDAVESAVAEHDRQTGTVPDGKIAEVKLAYSKLPLAKNKTAARNHLDERMKHTLGKELDPFKAKAYMDLGAEVKSTSARAEAVAKPPVDPTEAFVELATAHYLAVSCLTPSAEVAQDWPQRVQALQQAHIGEVKAWKVYTAEHAAWEAKAGTPDEETRGDEPQAPELSEVVQHAIKISSGRGTRSAGRKPKAEGESTTSTTSARAPYTGARRSVKEHIRQAFEAEPVGAFLKIGAIAKFQSTEYGDDRPSSGAVTAALTSNKWDLAGIVSATENGVNGARKVA